METTTVAEPQNLPSTPVKEATPTVEAPKEDLLTRVSKFTPEQTKPAETKEPIFDFKEYKSVVDSIKDPVQKGVLEKAYKEMESGLGKKFETIATLRKDLEAKVAQAQQKQGWTAERIQRELLSDPNFISEASKIAPQSPNPTNSGLTDDQWSALSEPEKARIKTLEGKINALEQQNSQANLQQQHLSLKQKYANYAPDTIMGVTNEVIQGKRTITLEDVWRSYDYESAVQRAYELGRQDAKGKAQEKIQSTSFSGGETAAANNVPAQNKGESGVNYFRRLAYKRLRQAQGVVGK